MRTTRQTLGKFKRGIRKWIDEKKFILYLNATNKENIYLIGTPDHSNIGDNAIAYAEIEFLKSMGIKEGHIKELTVREYNRYNHVIEKRLGSTKRLVFLHGGGNMGNQWLIEEEFRRKVLQELISNPIIMFPQTFYYTDDEEGRKECQKSISYYNNREQFIISAREKTSYELMKKYYPEAEVLLMPDIVLSLPAPKLEMQHSLRKGVLFILRNDGERTLTDSERELLFSECVKNGYQVSDMHCQEQDFKKNRKRIVSEKLKQFSEAELVITDRLHGMVFAAISGTRCIVFTNYNHKIIGTYEWLSFLPYVKFARNVAEAQAYKDELLKMPQIQINYDSLSGQFEIFRNRVEEFLLQYR